MLKRILPIYQTGWFYLLLLFWGFSFWYVSIGGLNSINQLNLNGLNQLKKNDISLQKNTTLKSADILILQSPFNESDITSFTTLLSYHPNAQIVFLGKQSPIFMDKLAEHLRLTPRKSKIIINSEKITSGALLKPHSTMIFTSLLNWLRFDSKPNKDILRSPYFTYTPLLQNERNTIPLLWHQQGKIYLSLPGELFRQLNPGNELLIKQNWQLSLLHPNSSSAIQDFPLGFFGEIFISETSVSADKENQKTSVSDSSELQPLSLYIQRHESTSNWNDEYKVIIITDSQSSNGKIIKPIFNKLVQHDFLYQNLLVIIFAWLLLCLGLALIWFIRQLSSKQQLVSVFSYMLLLLIFQYVLFNQQQWLEISPIIMTIMGTWLLLFLYQKEYNLFIVALNYQGPLNNIYQSSSLINQQKSEQVNTPLSKAGYGLEKTLTIVNNSIQSENTMSHHQSVSSFGRYQVEGILGKGAMGIVYQGVDPKINRHVAIKTLQLSDDIHSPEFDEAKERFFREAQTAGGLSHANIVTIYDVGEDNHLGYIAMDLLTGAPLSLFTQPGQLLPTPLVYQLLIQITDALDYAHNQNVVHRDIKPANIIYDDDLLKVTVTDFGIAYVSDNSKTRTGIIMGSPYYMSPEQILGLKVDGRSDIFSLGVTFYQLLCGHLPFEGESIATVAYQITKAKAVAVNQHNGNLPTSAMRICNKAMHKDIDKRFQSMAEFKLALTSALKRDFKVTTN
jgi:tRNA A-37 threonylcarbamoyl transferase component Bud32